MSKKPRFIKVVAGFYKTGSGYVPTIEVSGAIFMFKGYKETEREAIDFVDSIVRMMDDAALNVLALYQFDVCRREFLVF